MLPRLKVKSLFRRISLAPPIDLRWLAYARHYKAIVIIDDRPDVLQDGPPEFLCGAVKQLWHRESAGMFNGEHVVVADNWK